MLVYLQIREKRNDNINNKCNQTKLKIGINKDNHKRDKNIRMHITKLPVLCSTKQIVGF